MVLRRSLTVAVRFTGVALLLVSAAMFGCNTLPPPLTGDPVGAGAPVPDDTTAGGTGSMTGGGSDVGNGNISALEQLMLERINRARLRPGAEASRHGITVDEGIPGQLNTLPKPAVAYNGQLGSAARDHALDMLTNNFFAHDNLKGQTPFDRIVAAGYSFGGAGENLAWRGTTGTVDELRTVEQMHDDLFVDEGIPDRGHRIVILTEHFREVGVGIRRGTFTHQGTTFDSMMAVQDYGVRRASTEFFILGVVYNDANGNGQYDFGEGAANEQVRLDQQSQLTSVGGGYSFMVPAGSYTLTFQNGRSEQVRVFDKNVKVDLVDGSRVVVNLGLGDL